MQYLLALPTFITIFALIFMAAITLRSSNKLPNKFFIFFIAVDIVWLLSVWIINSAQFGQDVFWSRLAFTAGVGLVIAVHGFVSSLFLIKHTWLYNAFVYGVGVLMCLATLSTDWVISSVYINVNADYSSSPFPEYGQFSLLFIAYLFIGIIMFFSIFFQQIVAMRNEDVRTRVQEGQQIKAVAIGFGGFTVISLLTNLILPTIVANAWPSQFGAVGSLILAGAFFRAIRKYRLFEVKPAVIRGTVYLLLVTVLAVLFVSVINIGNVLSEGFADIQGFRELFTTAIALTVAVSFHPLKRQFDKLTDRIFYKESYKSEEFFETLSELLTSTTDLRGLLNRAAKHISQTLKTEQASFFLYYSNTTEHHLSAGTKAYSKLSLYDADHLKNYIKKHRESIFVTDMLPDKDEGVRRLLVSYGVAVLLPLRLKDKVVGFLCLGDKKSSEFTQRDLKVLTTIADNLIIAIQNALSVHEVREINASLQQRIEAATAELRESNIELHRLDMAKDEFVSMASHQLRTPLTSIKGYVSMMLDGDVGRITGAQKDALEEAYNSSERMVRLIGDFLSVSRLQTGKFMVEKKPANLVDVVKQEVAGLRMIASTHGQKIAFKPPKSLPIVVVDESKLRQVMMNFMDNAVYYSKTNSTITVTLAQEGEDIIFTVVDTGIGVPLEEQKKLFRKFFRAGNARQQRPDGTGVGLFLAKRIIADHHGKIIFKSVEGEGSTFGFRIPLDQKTDDADNDKKNSK